MLEFLISLAGANHWESTAFLGARISHIVFKLPLSSEAIPLNVGTKALLKKL